MNSVAMHYFEVFKRIDSGRTLVWNWPAALIGTLWFLYRKMYGYAFLSFVVTMILRAAKSCLKYQLHNASNEVIFMCVFLWLVAYTCFMAMMGLLGNYLFYQKVKNSVEQMTAENIEAFFNSNYGKNRLYYFIWVPIAWYVILFIITCATGKG